MRARLGARIRRRFDTDVPPFESARTDPPRSGGGKTSGHREAAGPRGKHDPELARYYANLEVPYGSDLATVERAWKRLLRRYHPDRHATDQERQVIANDLVKELNRAYAELKRRLETQSA